MDLSLPSGVVAEEEKDVLGGGGLLESGVYKGTIEMVYLDAAPSGAKRITIHLKYQSQVVKYTTYISNRAGGYTYNKGAGDLPLPGYSQMDSFFKAVTGQGIATQTSAEKTINIYDFAAKAEKPVEVTVFGDALGHEIAVGILSVKEEAGVKGDYDKSQTPPKFYDKNEFDKFFDAGDGLTVTERAANETTPAFLEKWKKKWNGKVKTVYTKKSTAKEQLAAGGGAVSGAPAAPAAATPALFG